MSSFHAFPRKVLLKNHETSTTSHYVYFTAFTYYKSLKLSPSKAQSCITLFANHPLIDCLISHYIYCSSLMALISSLDDLLLTNPSSSSILLGLGEDDLGSNEGGRGRSSQDALLTREKRSLYYPFSSSSSSSSSSFSFRRFEHDSKY